MSRVNRTARQRIELLNISIDLLGVRSGRHPLVASGCILRLPGNATSGANANVACKNSRFSSLLAAGDVSSSRNVPNGEELGVQAAQAQCKSLLINMVS